MPKGLGQVELQIRQVDSGQVIIWIVNNLFRNCKMLKLCITRNACICWAELNSYMVSLQWRHNGHDSISNHQPHNRLLNRLFRRRSKKISKLRVTGLCSGNSPETGEFPVQMASNAENVSIWWCHPAYTCLDRPYDLGENGASAIMECYINWP